MSSRSLRLTLALLAVVLVALGMGALAMAVSQSDVAYRDGFLDLNGLDAAATKNVTIDALGGLRLVTNGTVGSATWTSQTDFTTPAAPLGPVVGTDTLDAAGASGSLRLLSAPLAFRRSAAAPVLAPPAPLSPDGFSVGSMCVQRVGDTYYMWYTGVPENEYAQHIYLATSADGLTWTKETTPVLSLGAPGAFDSRQLGRPSVVYDPANTSAPFRMWYAGQGDLGGSIGYATSADGRTWTKAGEVLRPGRPGTADSYRVTDPCVLIDNGVYYMWYTADDSNNRRVAYATSVDGVTWQRGGIVFDLGTGNYSEGAFAPAVIKTTTGFHMVFTGNKVVAGTDIQSKLINADSTDGLTWAAGNIAFSPAGGSTTFDGYNVTQPTILSDPADTKHPYKMWYVGNNPDANGNYHDRIGLAYQKNPSTVSQWVKAPGPAGDPYYESVLTLGQQGAAFDSMKVADLRPVSKASGGLYGFYTGTNAADFTQRIGVAQSADEGATWQRVGTGTALMGTGSAGAFDEGGVACPAPVAKAGGGWYVFHTSLDAAGASRLGLHTVSADLVTVDRTATAPVVAQGTFDAGGQADPWAQQDGAAIDLFYAGKSGGVWALGLSTSATGDPLAMSAGTQILTPTAGSYDAGGLRDPVAEKTAAGTWRLFYTAIDGQGVERIAMATAPAAAGPWTKTGLVMTESGSAYDMAESGVRPAAVVTNGGGEILYFTGLDRFGWTRIGRAVATGAGYLDAGSATYQLDNPAARDWRKILWSPAAVPSAATREVWVSYSPTFTGADSWSKPFPITNDTDLPFLLTVSSIRWQVRMRSSDPAVTPTLDDLVVNHAPIQFPASGVATTNPIGPPAGLYLLSWGDLVLTADEPGGTSVKVEVRDDAGAQVVAPTTMTGGSLTIPLAGVAPAGGRLVAVCTLSGDGSVTPTLKSLTVGYTTTTTPSSLSLSAKPAKLTWGASAVVRGVLSTDPTPLDVANGDTRPLGGETVTISAHKAGTTGYVQVGTAKTGADGSFSLTVKPTATTTYRATWAGRNIGGVTYPPASAAAMVSVKPKVTLSLTKYNGRSGKYYRYAFGHPVYAKGAVNPNHYRLSGGGTGKVSLLVYKYRSASHTWAKVKTVGKALTSRSTYTCSYKPSARGTYRLVTSFAGDADHLAATSVFRYVKVY